MPLLTNTVNNGKTTRFRSEGAQDLGCLPLRLNLRQVVAAQRTDEIADFEAPGSDLADRGHLGCAADDEALLEAVELLRHDLALSNLDLAAAGEIHDGAPGDAIEE